MKLFPIALYNIIYIIAIPCSISTSRSYMDTGMDGIAITISLKIYIYIFIIKRRNTVFEVMLPIFMKLFMIEYFLAFNIYIEVLIN